QTSQSPFFCESVTLECQISGHPQPTVTWYREDYKIESSMDFQITFKAGLARLVIREAFAEDSGRFTCTATNKAGSVSTSSKEDLVRPHFVERLRNVSVKEGSRLEMAVKATGNPNPDIVWLKNSDIIVLRMINEFGYCSLDYGVAYSRDSGLTSSLKHVIASRRGRQTLTIKDINKDDQGEYSYVVDGKRTQCKLKMKRKHFLHCLYTIIFLFYSMYYSCIIVSQKALMFNILPLISIH
uniref:Ig-like domain-containing protein n=1 Tax=Junco hyemalis TaxID=40217 RepID=A0A8C5JB27_JUNHY